MHMRACVVVGAVLALISGGALAAADKDSNPNGTRRNRPGERDGAHAHAKAASIDTGGGAGAGRTNVAGATAGRHVETDQGLLVPVGSVNGLSAGGQSFFFCPIASLLEG